VLPYRPRAIVVYEGDNDVWKGVEAVEIRDTFCKFVRKVHAQLPETRIYFLAIKPSYKRRSKWSTMVEANRLIAAECDGDRRLRYVDIVPVLLDENGKVRRELFTTDDLHMNRSGYERVREVLRPVLMKHEMAFENQD
jgi:lysophospholipase L1-like esterase